jgi:hypothetical protein
MEDMMEAAREAAGTAGVAQAERGHCWCGLHVSCRDRCDRCNQRGAFAHPSTEQHSLPGHEETIDALSSLTIRPNGAGK